MDEKIFLDMYNIKTYPEYIIDYLKENNIKSNINNLRSFYSELLDSINLNVKESYLNRILKYLSSKEESTILILEDIKEGIYEHELTTFFNKIHELISHTNNYKYFYNSLVDQCSFLYFNDQEINNLQDSYNKNNFTKLLYLLFIHAASDYKINTPKIVAERLLNEAYCLFSSTKVRNVLIKASADLGNEIACTLYGTMLYPDYKKRLEYFLKGKNNPLNLWNIGFIIEHFELSKTQFQEVKNEIKNILIEGNKYTENIMPLNDDPYHKECLITALKIYFYLANEKNFSKGLCSVGKFFLEEMVAITKNGKIDKDASIKLGLDYSFKAIKLGNVYAMQNAGAYYYKHNQNTTVKYKELLQIAANAKDVASSVYTARILIDENKTDEVEEYLKFLSEENSGEALYRLGKIYEGKMQLDEAIKYYERAINNDYYSASIDLAKIYFEKYMNSDSNPNTKVGFILLSINILEKNYNEYSEKEKEEVDFLIKNYKSLI